MNYGFVVEYRKEQERALSVRRGKRIGTASGADFRLFVRPFPTTPEAEIEQQPIVAKNVILVYVGQVDNRKEVAWSLAKPHLCEASDGEILAEAYVAWGIEFPRKVLGEYSFALIDRRQHSLVAGRDSLGLRNLFYVQTAKTVWVASDLVLLLDSLPTEPHLDRDSLAEYFSLGGVLCTGRTLFQGVIEVPPAHVLSCDGSRVDMSRTWQPDPERCMYVHRTQDFDESLRMLLFDAVSAALRSNGRVCCDLSGGLDSSTVTTIAALIQQSGKGASHGLSVFSFVHSETSESDETDYQQSVLAAYPLEHHIVDGDSCLAFETLEDDVRGDPPWELLQSSRRRAFRAVFQRLGIQTRVTGLGGDQVFCGPGFPPLYLSDLLHRWLWRQWVRESRAWLHEGQRSLWNLVWHCSRDRLSLAAGQEEPARPPWLTPMFGDQVDRLTHELWRAGTRHFASAASELHYRRITRLPPALRFLRRSSEDVRCPLLYRPLVEFMLTLPWELKVRPGADRVILRRAMKGILPEKVRCRRGKGEFTTVFLRGLRENWSVAEPFTSGTRLAELRLVEPRSFQAACERFRHGVVETHLPYLMAAILLEVWLARKADIPRSLATNGDDLFAGMGVQAESCSTGPVLAPLSPLQGQHTVIDG